MLNQTKYSFSFTGASALITETLIVAEEYEKLKDWKAVQKSLLDNNLLNKVKVATFSREFREIRKRLSLLTPDQIRLMVHGSFDDAKAMILLSLVKTYPLIKDFIIEVLRIKFLIFDKILTEVDYTRFFRAKSHSHQELNELSETTLKKVNQRVITILEQIGLISQVRNGVILKPILSDEVLNVIIKDDPALLASFLFSNEEIKSCLQKQKHA